MWELIAVNKRNSIILLASMAAVLAGMGYLIGLLFAGPQGGFIGLAAAAGLWAFLSLISFSQGDQILLASSRAMEVGPDVHPMLFNVVEEMTLAAGLPKMPKVYIIPDESPNAFATGRNPQNASVAVTAGLLAQLDRDQLQGVIAHEISHIIHRDILFVTLAGVMLGAIVILAEVMMRSMWFGSMGSSRRFSGRSSRGNSGGAALAMILIAVILAILAPLFARVLYFALSRRREYLADAGAVRLTRYPEGLAGALEKIAQNAAPMTRANKATAPMYIANPFRAAGAVGLFSTHPPIKQRIQVLRSISKGAGYRDYDTAYRQVTHSGSVVPASGLAEKESADIRPPAEPQPAQRLVQQRRGAQDMIRKLEGFAMLNCACGVKLKIPPSLKTNKVVCPRCGVVHSLNRQTA